MSFKELSSTLKNQTPISVSPTILPPSSMSSFLDSNKNKTISIIQSLNQFAPNLAELIADYTETYPYFGKESWKEHFNVDVLDDDVTYPESYNTFYRTSDAFTKTLNADTHLPLILIPSQIRYQGKKIGFTLRILLEVVTNPLKGHRAKIEESPFLRIVFAEHLKDPVKKAQWVSLRKGGLGPNLPYTQQKEALEGRKGYEKEPSLIQVATSILIYFNITRKQCLSYNGGSSRFFQVRELVLPSLSSDYRILIGQSQGRKVEIARFTDVTRNLKRITSYPTLCFSCRPQEEYVPSKDIITIAAVKKFK